MYLMDMAVQVVALEAVEAVEAVHVVVEQNDLPNYCSIDMIQEN